MPGHFNKLSAYQSLFFNNVSKTILGSCYKNSWIIGATSFFKTKIEKMTFFKDLTIQITSTFRNFTDELNYVDVHILSFITPITSLRIFYPNVLFWGTHVINKK